MKKMINELTKEQIAKFPEYVDKWTKIGLSTEPADRPRAEIAIKKMYEVAKLKEPKIVWCDSPCSAYFTILIIEKLSKEKLDSIFDSVRTSVGASVGDSVMASVGDSVGASIWATVIDSVWASVCASVLDYVRASVGASVMDSVGSSVMASVGDSVRTSVMDSVGSSVMASVGDSVRTSVRDSVRDSVSKIYHNCIEGSHLSYLSAFYLFFRNECSLISETEKGLPFFELTESCGWIFPYENICFASERHNVLNRDTQGRLHSETTAAIEYPDGFKKYAIHGVRIPEYVVLNPEKITVELIEKEENVEVKRIMIARYKEGVKSYMFDSGSVLIDEKKDIHSGLPIKLWRKDRFDDNPIVMVEMLNKTKEQDDQGNWIHKPYYIRVKPDITDALYAIAWHHNQTVEDYVKTQIGT